MSWDGVRAARVRHERSLFRRANVLGVALGHKVTGGRETHEPCVVVYVERKLPEAALARRDVVPKDLEGVRTDVVQTGRFRALVLMQRPDPPRTTRVRPAPCGVSVGHVRVTAGTLGVLARRRDGTVVVLSNNHILANSNDAAPGDAILQPGRADGGIDADAIARLTDFVPIAFSEPGAFGRFLERIAGPLLARLGLGLRRLPSDRANLVDAAIAEPTGPDLVTPEILGIGRVRGTADPDVGMRVAKSGRTTGVTWGTVTALDGVVHVDYGGKTALFRQVVVSDLHSRGGDSGSLVLDGDERAVGLLFAGSDVTTLANPIGAVQQLLDIEL
jgi:hypothetical protein